MLHTDKYDEHKSPRSFQNNDEQEFDNEDGHEPNKYFDGEAKLSEIEKLTEHKIIAGQDLNGYDIENACSNWLVNKIYCNMPRKKRRKKAIILSANTILQNGRNIKDQIDKNDSLKKSAKKGQDKSRDKDQGNDLESQNNAQQSSTTAPKNGKSDIPRISGGTLSEVMTKMTEMLAGKSGDDRKSSIDNFSATMESMSVKEVNTKFADMMKILAKDPTLVADIKDVLQGTEGRKIFDTAINKYCSKDEKQAINSVSADALVSRREESVLNNQKDQELMGFASVQR